MQIEGYREDEQAEVGEVDMVLVDSPQALFRFLLGEGPNPAWPQDAIFPHNEEEMFRAVNYDQVVGWCAAVAAKLRDEGLLQQIPIAQTDLEATGEARARTRQRSSEETH